MSSVGTKCLKMRTPFRLSSLWQFSQDDSLHKNRIKEMEVLSYDRKIRICASSYPAIKITVRNHIRSSDTWLGNLSINKSMGLESRPRD